MEIHFEPVRSGGSSGRKIIACRIIQYLLEQSRVTTQTRGERAYHIFAQLCAGLETGLRDKFGLEHASTYHYLNQSDCYTIDGVDDGDDWEATVKAMYALQFTRTQIESIWQLLVAVLQIGNLRMVANPEKTDLTVIENTPDLERACATLGLPSHDVLASALVFRSVTIRGSISMIPLKPPEAEANRDALAKTIYSKLFDFIVQRMNVVLFADGATTAMTEEEKKRTGRSIGILDIFGFEIFETNLIEQFFINFGSSHSHKHKRARMKLIWHNGHADHFVVPFACTFFFSF